MSHLFHPAKPPLNAKCFRRFAAFLYTLEGKVVIERAWEETLAELNFAGVRKILDDMKA